MARNIELLEKLYRVMDEDHRRIDMSVWGRRNSGESDCGTTGCAAGWTAMLSGRKLYWSGSDSRLGGIANDHGTAWTTVSHYAKEALGLSYEEAHLVFHNTSDEDILPMLKKLIAGEDILVYDQ